MQLTITFKTPDAVETAVAGIADPVEQQDARVFLRKFIKHGEYITVSFDTLAREVKVLSSK